jgi:hypothetical protein
MTTEMKTENKVTVDITVIEDARQLLARMFDDHPAVRDDVNKVWAVVQVLQGHIQNLSNMLGAMNETIITLREQRDKLVVENSRKWDEGYDAGARFGQIGADEEKTMALLRQMLIDQLEDKINVHPEDAAVFVDMMMAGDLRLDEADILAELIEAVAYQRNMAAESEDE